MKVVNLKAPNSPKERNLLKGAMRRVFSRSEIRQLAIKASQVEHSDPERPRVKKWSFCPDCKQLTPTYKMQVDHIVPIIRPGENIEDLSWDTLVERLWCDLENLRAVCIDCHKIKSKAEQKERRRLKKETKNEK